MKTRLSNYIKNYERKESDDDPKNKSGAKKQQDDDDKADDDKLEDDEFSDLRNKLPLPEGVLKVNLGIPIIVLGHKIDLMIRGDKS